MIADVSDECVDQELVENDESGYGDYHGNSPTRWRRVPDSQSNLV